LAPLLLVSQSIPMDWLWFSSVTSANVSLRY
jgi:hypothetical protein